MSSFEHPKCMFKLMGKKKSQFYSIFLHIRAFEFCLLQGFDEMKSSLNVSVQLKLCSKNSVSCKYQSM